MNTKLDKITEEWMQMERTTPEQIEAADHFYDTNIMPLIEENYIERHKNLIDKDIEYLIASVGFSYEPIVLNIKLFHPKKILFLYTKEAESTLDKVVSYTSLLPSSYEKCKVSSVESSDCYQEIKRYYMECGRPEKMYIDFTGGTKAMSAAAAMAGAFMNVQVVYVNTKMMKGFRKPKPGSETLYFIENPWSVFGDLEIEKAFSLFGEYAYAGARDKIAEIRNKLFDPVIRQQLEFAELLALVYEKWEAFNFSYAFIEMDKLIKQLEYGSNRTRCLLIDFTELLNQQASVLEDLRRIQKLSKDEKDEKLLADKEAYTALMFTMYKCADMREKQKKYDMATLLWYRLLEMIVQKRLYAYHLLTSAMNYMELKIHTERMQEWIPLNAQERRNLLKEKMTDIRRKVFPTEDGEVYLPAKATLVNGYIILAAFNDPITEADSKDIIGFLMRVKGMIELRNSSIFAHGFQEIEFSKQYKNFRKLAEQQFKIFCQTEDIDFDGYLKCMNWINPMESVNYPIGI